VAPKISVVLPVFNGGAELSATIDSLLAQTEGDFELVVVDDGSADATGEILAGYAARDRRVKVLTQDNAGITAALVRGCAAASAPLIARQDSGDVSLPDRFRRMIAFFEDPACAVASCQVAYVGPEGELLYRTTRTADDIQARLLGAGLPDIASLPHHGAAVMRTEAYRHAGGYRLPFYFAQDLDLWIRMAALGAFRIADEVLYEARLGLRSISSVHRTEQIACAQVALAVRDAVSAENREALLDRAAQIRPRRQAWNRRAEARALYFVAASLRKRGDRRWRRYAARAMRRYPLYVRSWLLFLPRVRP
jgi:glycosyltransferase involved in cell wall biosynthesis